MSDGPTHYVLIEDADGEELRRLGPMAIGRAYQVKSKLENNPARLGDGNAARIADNPLWDFKHNREIADADSDQTSGRAADDRRRHHGDSTDSQG